MDLVQVVTTAMCPSWAEALENGMAMRNPRLLLPTAQAAPTDTHHLRSLPLRVTKSPSHPSLEAAPAATGNGFAAVRPMAPSLQTWPCALATKAAGPTRTTHTLGVRPAGTHTWHLLQNPFSSQKIWAAGLGLSVAQNSRPVWPGGTTGSRKAVPLSSPSNVWYSRGAGRMRGLEPGCASVRRSERVAGVSVPVRAWLRVSAAVITVPGRGRSPPPTSLRNLSESASGSAY